MQYELGGAWKCECGKEHKLSGAYLAAHWDIELVHNCDCGLVHTVQSGFITLVEEQLKRNKAKKNS